MKIKRYPVIEQKLLIIALGTVLVIFVLIIDIFSCAYLSLTGSWYSLVDRWHSIDNNTNND